MFTDTDSTRKKTGRIPVFLLYLLAVYVWFLVVFNLFRFILLFTNTDRLDQNMSQGVKLSLLEGFRFDIMIVSYLMAPAFLFYLVAHFIINKKNNKQLKAAWAGNILKYYFIVLNILIVVACAADIPYYKYFNTRITKAVWNWVDSPWLMLKFIFGTVQFYPMLGMMAVLIFSGSRVIKKCRQRFGYIETAETAQKKQIRIFLLVTAFLLFWGTRGGGVFRPLAMKDAFMSNNGFINALTINPLHSYFNSLTDMRLKHYTDEEAVANVKAYYKIKDHYDSPVARKVAGTDSAGKKNVFLILVESLYYDMAFDSKKKVMPFLDSLKKLSRSYESVYSSGIHTHNGLYAALFGFPSLPGVHPFSNNNTAAVHYTGLANTLKENGYATGFYCTHDPEFDNLGFFLPHNGYDRLYSKHDYPEKNIANGWGISDEYLFEYCLNETNKLAQTNRPFLNVLLTISTHQPAELPKPTSFKTTFKNTNDQVYAYADWCLKNFMKNCRKERWFENTVFVILGDHGITTGEEEQLEMPMSVHHIPLLIYEPGKEAAAKSIDVLGSQMDVYPTVMDVLGLPYVNNSFGIDLEKENRDYSFFLSDDRLGILDKNYLLVERNIGGEALYSLAEKKAINRIEAYGAEAARMKKYAYSVMQCAGWLIEHGKEKKQ